MRVIRKEVRRRGIFGWIFLLVFLGFNAVMALWMFFYWKVLSGAMPAVTEAGRAGAAVGAMFGTAAILFFWVAGAVITGLLALLTRGRKTIIEERFEEPRF